jgi:hypothetical protein
MINNLIQCLLSPTNKAEKRINEAQTKGGGRQYRIFLYTDNIPWDSNRVNKHRTLDTRSIKVNLVNVFFNALTPTLPCL